MWNQITLDVPDDLKDAVVGEFPSEQVAGFWEQSVELPGMVRLTVYFQGSPDLGPVEAALRALFQRCQLPHPDIHRSRIEDCDWTEEWKKSYSSFPIGEDFFIIPSWSDIPCPDERLPIRIDPGQAFGTGTHETTQLTIELLERWVEPHHVVLDVGTGSGILAIAARLLGAREVIACDIDPVAVQVALANIERNSEDEIWTFCGSVESIRDHSVHLLLGNLTNDLLVRLLPEFDRILAPSGIAIFSGILNEQREQFLDGCQGCRFSIHEEIARGEWLALVAARHAG